MNIRPRDLHRHPHRCLLGNQIDLHRCLLGNQIDPHRCLPPLRGATWELEREQENDVRQPELEAPLTKRKLKHRQNRDSKLAKKFVSLDAEISNLKSQMEALEDKITKASKSTNAGFKRKNMRSMKRKADKIAEKRKESEKALKLVESRVPKDLISGAPLKQHPPSRPKHLEN